MPCAKWIVALLAAAALPAGAEASGPLQTAHLTSRLYEAGVASGDAILVLTAAKLRREAGLPEGTALDWTVMFATAESLATGDSALEDLVADIRAEQSKGVASGPEYQIARLDAGAVETRPAIAFRGGEYAEVYVEGPLGVDLNLTVLDGAGQVICTDKDHSHVAYCGWTPATDGEFLLEIENAGAVAADYALMTN
jgi:hypothetical protein